MSTRSHEGAAGDVPPGTVIDPNTGFNFDDTKRYVDATPNLSATNKKKVFEDNALKVYPRLKGQIEKQAHGNA
jgi:hypothetical protein